MKKKDLAGFCGQMEQLALATMGSSVVLPLREPGYLYYHGRRVARLCLQLAKLEGEKGVALHLLYAAGLFHDVAKGQEQHALAGADRIPALLQGHCSDADCADIARLVGAHNARSLPNRHRKDVRLLQDADTLDHFGAQSIWLGIYYTARTHKTQAELLAYYKSADYLAYTDRCERCLNFESSRKQLRQRLRTQNTLLRTIATELSAE